MTASKGSRFPWRKGSIVLLLLIGAVLAYDLRKHGSFEASSTGKFMKNSGIMMYGQKAWMTTKMYSVKGLECVEASAPEYYKATIDLCTPYIKLTKDICLVMKNLSIKLYENIMAYIMKNGPLVVETIEHYAPGMLDEIRTRSMQGLELIKVYSAMIGEIIIEHSTNTIRWLGRNVFVGKLSPENLQNYANRAIDTTQTLASQTYDWVYEKVQTLSKVP